MSTYDSSDKTSISQPEPSSLNPTHCLNQTTVDHVLDADIAARRNAGTSAMYSVLYQFMCATSTNLPEHPRVRYSGNCSTLPLFPRIDPTTSWQAVGSRYSFFVRSTNSKSLKKNTPVRLERAFFSCRRLCPDHRNPTALCFSFLLFSADLGLTHVAGAVAGIVAPLLRLVETMFMQLSRAEVGAAGEEVCEP